MKLKRIIVNLLLILFIASGLAALVITNVPFTMSEERTYHTLEANGFKREDTTLGGFALFGCDNMKLRRKFTAVRDGKKYEGRVCGNWFSGASVRID